MHWFERQQREWLAEMYDSKPASSPAMAVYRRNFLGVHGSALEQTFPRTLKLIGEKKFRYIAQKLLRHHPVQSGDLNQYGDAFPELILSEGESLPLQAHDLARFEWAQLACMFSKNINQKQLVEYEHLALLSENKFEFIASVEWLHFHFPVHITSTNVNSLEFGDHFILLFLGAQGPQWQVLSKLDYVFCQSLIDSGEMLTATAAVLDISSHFELLPLMNLLLNNKLLIFKE